MATNEPTRVDALIVDDRGVRLSATSDVPVDVLFDGHRVFSFWTERDTAAHGGYRLMEWPHPLRRFLDGTVLVEIADPASGAVLASTRAVLGSGEGVVRVQDSSGNRLGLDKNLRLSKLFGDRDAAQLAPLLASMRTALDALQEAGVRPFLAYGTLLGAVRDGDFIGHDSDADLGYVSDFDHPADAIRESMALQRLLQRRGYETRRYSGLGFQVMVEEGDGVRRGLDVFGGFMREGTLYLMGEVAAEFRPEWLYPLSEVSLAGETFPAPAEPEHLLAAMYGPSWRVPDPAFQFTTSRGTKRRLDGWFRGIRTGFDERWLDKRQGGTSALSPGVSPFAKWVFRRERKARLFVDAGSGRGRDAIWLSRRRPTVGLDFFPPDLKRAARRAERRGAEAADFMWCNFGELRSTLVTSAELSRRPGPRIVLAHHLVDANTRRSTQHLLLMARMLAGDSGRLYLQAYTRATTLSRAKGLTPVPPAALRRMIEESGGQVVHLEHLTEQEAGFVPGPTQDGPGPHEPTIDRMAISWTR